MKRFNSWVIKQLNNFLSSTTGLYIALIVPLAVIVAPDPVKAVENILSSNWLQLWALFVLAIMSKKSDEKHNAHAKKLDRIHNHLGITKED